ncbi:MAG: chromosomal replication initiator protein DnaA [Candidatus Gracilibacteria bacterium]|jgi:chromosomal replication initiator protein|nr:chromosomal replication initiator protein DnaA [Candidatus Gracilibacteria bacterium]
MIRKDFWIEVLKKIQPEVKKANFVTWFSGTTVLNLENGVLKVGVPTSFARDWISGKYSDIILAKSKEIDESVSSLEFDICSRLMDKTDGGGVDVKKSFVFEDEKKVRRNSKNNEITVMKGSNVKVVSQMLNPKYSLKNFVVGRDNRLPHAAAMAVSNTPGGIYNPLYIYGSTGLGKTHLVQAIGNEIVHSYPDLVVKYLTAERFVTDVVEAIGKRHMQKFKDQYRNIDVFMIDDVQFFAKKDSSQQELFHTFNFLYDQNKQIVITSDRPPSELDGLDDRLKSRFGMGMVVELLMPDYETRVAILRQKCREFEVLIDPEVINFIATNIEGSVRGLEGVLKAAIAESQLGNRVPTIRSVAEIIKRFNKAQEIIGFDIEKKRENKGLDIESVISFVAEYYGISADRVKGSDRHKELMNARQVSMYLIKNELGHSYEKIGASFGGKNHTTVMHACNKVNELLKNDTKILRDINAIKRDMGL